MFVFKIFSTKLTNLMFQVIMRRMCYLTIKEMRTFTENAFIVTQRYLLSIRVLIQVLNFDSFKSVF